MNPLFANHLSDLVNVANRHSGKEFTPDFRDSINTLLEAAEDNQQSILKPVSEILPSITAPTGAGLLGVWLGAAIEGGKDPTLSVSGIELAMLKWSKTIITNPEGTYGHDPDPDDEVVSGLELLGRALVAHLSKSDALLEGVRRRTDLAQNLERIEHLSYGAMWVAQLFRQQAGSLVVLDVRAKRGAMLEYRNISNCFHLFTLLQGALADWIPKANRTPETALAIAKGQANGEADDKAHWHYGQPSVSRPDFEGMIFGEAAPDSIESIDGQQVILLWPNILKGRGWDAGFFSPILTARLPSMLLVNQLSPAEFHRWAEELQLPGKIPVQNASQSDKPWWEFW